MDFRREVEAAAGLISGRIRHTPCQPSRRLSQETHAQVFLKLENHQVTGSFKVRGALHKLLTLDAASAVVAASSGNHGAAVAHAARALGLEATVVVPTVADPAKIANIEDYGARVIIHGGDCVEAEAFARAHAETAGEPYISPYNDREVMMGQGTIGLEIAQELGAVDAVFVALGGGGLISGIGGYLKALHPDTQIIACSPERSPAMHGCLEAGRIIDVPCFDTLSDATAGGVEPGSITFATCQAVIDRSLVLGEEAIAQATRTLIEREHLLVEGAAGLALAGFLATQDEWSGKRIAIVLCGGNIGREKLLRVLAD